MTRRSGHHTNLSRMLNAPDKGVSKTAGVAGVLAGVFRDILQIKDIKNPDWTNLLHRYVNASNKRDSSSRYKTGLRGNLTKSLYNTEMTWKTFCKGLQFLRAKSFHIQLTVTYHDDTVTQHEKTIIFDTEYMEFDDDDLPKE